MAVTKTTNPTLAALTTKVNPGDAFKVVCMQGEAARTGVIMFAYAVTAFMFNVNHFRPTDDKDYRTVKDAKDYVLTELKKQTTVKGGMLDRYVNVGADLYGKLKTGRFADIHKKLAALSDAKKAPDILFSYLKDKAAIETLSDLMRALGYSTGHDKRVPPVPASPEKRAAALEDTVANIAKAFEKDHKQARTAARAIAAPIVAAIPDKVELARLALAAVTDAEDLMTLAKLANDLADKLLAEEEKAEKAAPKAAKAKNAKAKAATKAKAAPVTQSASA